MRTSSRAPDNNEMKLTKGTATEVERASRHFVPRRTSIIKVPFAAYLGVVRTGDRSSGRAKRHACGRRQVSRRG
jgi:hypothetical protein